MLDDVGVPTWKIIDLFAGCGGMTSGFVAAGFEPVLAVEIDRAAASTYATNFGAHHARYADIAEISDADIPPCDVIIGGPPCQGFSNLGSRNVHDPRNKLWKEYIRFVRHARPMIFVIENVDRFFSSSEFALLRSEAEPGGLLAEYQLSAGFLLAADFGVPQRRKRTIVIGSRIGEIPLPQPTHARPGTESGLPDWHGTRAVLADVAPVPPTKALPESWTSVFDHDIRGPFKAPELHIGRTPTQLSMDRYRHIPPGGGRFDLPERLLPRCWREKKTGTTDVMGRMRWDMPSLTIRTEFYKPEKGQYLHPQWDRDDPSKSVDRPITHYEAARLQSFPDSFAWCGSKIEIARQIGNAVPPLLAAAIARQIRPYLSGAEPDSAHAAPCRLCG